MDATNAQNTDYAYNKASVQTRVTYPDDSPGTSRGYVVYSYDAALRLTRINHQDDTNTDVAYDSMGRRLTLTKGEEIDSFAYAATGQVTLAKRGLWIAVLRSYDGLGRLTRETQQNGRDRNVDYAYDKAGNVLTLTYPNSGAVQTTYDALGRALTAKRNGSVLATYNYTGYRPKTQTFETGANDVTLNMTYDGMARMTRMQYAQTGNTSLPNFSYGFDSASDITRKTFNDKSGTPSEDYQYDTLTRLTRTTFGQRASTPYKGYIYNDLGNHLTQDDNGTTTVGLFNAVNEQTKRGVNDILYDSRGNLTKDDSGKGYFYDRQNMLTCVEDAQGNLVMRYAYDAFNRLIERDCNWAYAMQYDYDGWRRLEECPSDDPGAHRCFVWTPGTAGYIDDLICLVNSPAQYQNNITYFACHNHNFSVTAMLTSGGAVVERYDYNPYGERLVLDADYTADADGLSDQMNPIGFQGLVHDDETGLIYVRNRYLKPTLGTWMTRDPLGYPDGMNAYAAYHVFHGITDPFGLTTYGPEFDMPVNSEDNPSEPDEDGTYSSDTRFFHRLSYDIWHLAGPKIYTSAYPEWDDVSWHYQPDHPTTVDHEVGYIQHYEEATCECVRTNYRRNYEIQYRWATRTRDYHQSWELLRMILGVRKPFDLVIDAGIAYSTGASFGGGLVMTSFGAKLAGGAVFTENGVLANAIGLSGTASGLGLGFTYEVSQMGKFYLGWRWKRLKEWQEDGTESETRWQWRGKIMGPLHTAGESMRKKMKKKNCSYDEHWTVPWHDFDWTDYSGNQTFPRN